MKRIVLLRHGQSTWNKENRFTGWTDVDLTQEGVAEAVRAGELLRDEGFTFGKAYTSYLKRAVKTLDCVLDKLDEAWIPVEKSWRLNEKHYGMLQGLNKSETAEKYGEEQVHVWRRSYDVAPDPLPEDDPRNPRFDVRYACVPDAELPRTESLEQTIARILPYWHCVVFPSLMRYDSLLVSYATTISATPKRSAAEPRPSPDRAAPADGAKKRGRISAKSGPFPIYIPYNSPAIRRTAAPARA